MASLTTPVQGWPIPADSDAPAVAADMRLLGTALDAPAKRLSGLASARPVAASTPVDTIYYATDTGVYSISTGAAWGTMLVAGAWTALTLGSGVSGLSGAYVPSARQEGDVARMKGTIQNTSGASIAGGTTLFSVPAALVNTQASAQITYRGMSTSGGTAGNLSVAAGSAAFSFSGILSAGSTIELDNLSYTLS